MNRQYAMRNILGKVIFAALAALLTVGIGSIAAAAAPPMVSISNIPLTLVSPAHPQVLLMVANSQSVDGDLSGAIMTGSGTLGAQLVNSSSPLDFTVPTGFTPPITGGAAGSSQPYTASCGSNLCDNSASRLNVAKQALQAILQIYAGNTDFGLMDYSTGGASLYTTWVYWMSNPGGFTFASVPPAAPAEYVNNPCYGITSGTLYSECTSIQGQLGSQVFTQPYMLVQNSSDDPTVNDVLYAGGQPSVFLDYGSHNPPTPYPPYYSLANYESGSVSVGYSSCTPGGCIAAVGPTNAGFVPYSDQVYYAERGFGYYVTGLSSNSGNMLVPISTAGTNATPAQINAYIATFTPYLQPETNNPGTGEIKALAYQSPIAGLIQKAVSYYGTNPPSNNGCPPQRYAVLITDGLPTMDLAGNNWPPLGSASAAGYGVTASFDPTTGKLTSTNDQALTDTINELTALNTAGIKTYIIGVGAGVNPALNPQAAATMKAMAYAGGTGNYFAATSPNDVVVDMQAILSAIQAANMSVSSAAVNSTGLKAGAVAYQAQFTSADQPWQDWTGNLVAYPILSSGTVNTTTPLWKTQAQLDVQAAGSGWDTGRIIATWNPVLDKGVPFRWGAGSGITASTTLGQELGSTDTQIQNVVNYLRGDPSNDQQNGGPFRNRSHILGDIVDSNPLYVGPPNEPFQDTSYVSFELAQQNRPAVLYVGADDGMLHAIDPTTGNEKFAFIPNGVFANLVNLTNPLYNQRHQFFVDGSPTAGDVQFSDSSWHTLVVGGLNAGGNSIYALDVTNPLNITSESALASDVLWEFTDPYLGLTYSQPVIARTNVTGSDFVVFFGSGYNNSDGNPYLYAVNAQTGMLLARINLCAAPGVPTGACNTSLPNGLSSPVAVNSTGALTLPDDTVYAGDLQGNLWKVNISDPNPALWTVQLLFQACIPAPPAGQTCQASGGTPQPITVAPTVSLHPNFPRDTGTIVYFGTGQLLGTPDLTNTNTQTFYAVWDKPGLSYVATRSNLVQQVLSAPTAGPAGTTVRLVTNAPIDWTSKLGWYEDLSISGERVVTDPRLENGVVVFTTYVPSASSCAVGGQSWLLVVNYKNGGSFPNPQLDLNGDGMLNSGDQVSGQNPVGLYLGQVYSASPTIISASLGSVHAVKLISQSSGQIQRVGEAGGPKQRQSWREIPN